MDQPGSRHIDGKRGTGVDRFAVRSTTGPHPFSSSIDLHNLSARIKQHALKSGFDLAGIASADPPARSLLLDAWLDRGYDGEMAYLRRNAEIRKDIRKKFPWAASLVCMAYRHPSDRPDRGIARHIARYAQGDDYHDILDAPLREVERYIREATREFGQAAKTWRYIDTGPVMEKPYAASAGIGWIGKNTLLLNESVGSYLLLAEIITDLKLPPDPPVAERCGSCTRCLDACPTQAFVSPYVLDATRCISYHTIETGKLVPEQIAARIEGNLFGCDICQEVCPWNRAEHSPGAHKGEESPERTLDRAFRTRAEYLSIAGKDFLTLSDETFQSVFRKSPLKRPGLAKLRSVARTIFGPASPGAPEEE